MRRAPFHRWRRRRLGVSLVELLIAVALVAIGFIGVSGAMAYAARVSRLAQDTMLAENLASNLLSQAREENFSDLDDGHTYPGEQGLDGLEESFNEKLELSRLPKAQAWVTVTDVQQDLKGVSVIITWGTGSPGGRIETETLVSPRF